jgi:hypothetical protein
LSPALAQRQAALAGVALLATLGTLALGRGAEQPRAPADENAPPPVGEWEEALAAPYEVEPGQASACGIDVTPETIGIAHPILPCGVDLVVGFGGREVRTEVIDRGPAEPGYEFGLTEALARELGVSGAQRIRWRFAD